MSSPAGKSCPCWELHLEEDFPSVSAPGAAVWLLRCGIEQSQSGQKGFPRLQHVIFQGCTHPAVPWSRRQCIPRDTCRMEGVSVLKTSRKHRELLLQGETSEEKGLLQIGVLK